MDFFGGLNHDIRARFQYIPRCITGMYVRACTFERQIQEDALGDYNYYSSSCSQPSVGSFTVAPTRAATPQIVSATSSQVYGTLSSFVPTSATSLRQGNSKGIDDITSHENDACLVNLNASCVELPVDLSTSPILENLVTVMNASCDQTTEISTILSAPIELTVDAKESIFNHFDMTSNLGDDSVSNDLLHVCLFKHVVACKSDASKVYSPMLGWFNDEHCQPFEMNKSFTYMCKLSCNIFMPSTSCDNILALYFMNYESYSCIHVSYVQKPREVKMDDIYIYIQHVHLVSFVSHISD